MTSRDLSNTFALNPTGPPMPDGSAADTGASENALVYETRSASWLGARAKNSPSTLRLRCPPHATHTFEIPAPPSACSSRTDVLRENRLHRGLPGKRRAKPRNGTRRAQGSATSLTIPASSYGNALGSDSARDPGSVSISERFSLFRDRRKPRCSPRSQRGRTRHGRGYISREPPFGRVRVSVGWWHRVIPTRPAAE